MEQAKTSGSKYLAIDVKKHTHLTYSMYSKRYKKVMDALMLDSTHKPHDPRKQFVSMGKDAGMNEYAIKRIVGHRISDITEKIYTEHDPNWLSNEIEKIKAPV